MTPGDKVNLKQWPTRVADLEAHLHRNGTRVIKFFLHLSQDEQRKRFLARIDEPDKNWKFRLAGVQERKMALRPDIPTYSGGLGVLAGDTIRSPADLKLPMVAVTLVHRQGYFAQKLDANGWQTEAPVAWEVAKFCHELPAAHPGGN